MQASTTGSVKAFKPIGAVFFEHVWEESWTYIKTVVDVMREPVLILNKELCVMAANEPFYKTFRVQPKDTEHHLVYELGNGQWDIPALKKLLEDILAKNTFFKGFEVEHEFPTIGRKHILLNARQIHFKEVTSVELAPPIILLAMEDVTEMMEVAETLANHETRLVELVVKLTERTRMLEDGYSAMAKDISRLKQLGED
jgi:nitrogen-specific signal transduction histidine kinase